MCNQKVPLPHFLEVGVNSGYGRVWWLARSTWTFVSSELIDCSFTFNPSSSSSVAWYGWRLTRGQVSWNSGRNWSSFTLRVTLWGSPSLSFFRLFFPSQVLCGIGKLIVNSFRGARPFFVTWESLEIEMNDDNNNIRIKDLIGVPCNLPGRWSGNNDRCIHPNFKEWREFTKRTATTALTSHVLASRRIPSILNF